MVVFIGTKILNNVSGIPGAARSNNDVTLQGFFSSRKSFTEFDEMFRKSVSGISRNTYFGGRETGFDKTNDSSLTKYCLFDDNYLKDGWYMIYDFSYVPEKLQDYFPFSISLFFVGTKNFIGLGFTAFLLNEEINDWSI